MTTPSHAIARYRDCALQIIHAITELERTNEAGAEAFIAWISERVRVELRDAYFEMIAERGGPKDAG